MKKLLVLILFISLLSACSSPKQPEFKSIINIEVIEFTERNIVVNADAIFHNPNPYSCTLQQSDIDVFVNEINVGKAKQIAPTEIPSNADFKMPIQIHFPPSKIYKEKNSLINIALSAFVGKKIDLLYKGSVTISVLEIPYTVPVDYKDEITLKRK